MPWVIFVCWGNICRSPMAERVARGWAEREGLEVRITSAATSADELGRPMDPRAQRTLRRAGYEASGHRAHRLSATEVKDADLVIVMEELHRRLTHRLVPGAANVRLLTDFDPDAPAGSEVPDPWYGDESGFSHTLASLEAAMPGILAAVRRLD